MRHNLANGTNSTIGTAHAPFDFKGQKEMGKGNFTLIPNGIPSLEDRMCMLYHAGVKTGRLSLNRFVDCGSTEAAKLFGLYPRKGAIEVGSDADLVVFDPKHKRTISARTHLMAVDYNPFEGMTIEGQVETVTVRGKVMVRDAAFVGDNKHGKFLKREPNHF
jgi:dihydropyrimidinase